MCSPLRNEDETHHLYDERTPPPESSESLVLPTPDTVEPTTLVLLDPTSPDGESALHLLTDADQHITLVVLLWDSAGAALRQFAEAEDLDPVRAGTTYLNQVAARIDRSTDTISFEVVDGTDATLELAMLEHTYPTRRVLRPATAPARFRPPRIRRLRVADRFRSSVPAQEHLTSSALSQKAPPSEVARLSQLGTLLHMEKPTQLLRHGADPTSACMVLDGTLSVERNGSQIARVGPGDFVGEISLLCGAACNADVFAEADTAVLQLGPAEFAELLETCPRITKHLLQASVHRLLVA